MRPQCFQGRRFLKWGFMSCSRKNASCFCCRLYLVQHGQSESVAGFSGRPLTEVGRNTSEHAAAWASRIGLSVNEIWHSGKLRAKQTAEIFANSLQPPGGIHVQDGLNPRDDVNEFAKKLDNLGKSVMLVGHLPFLARLAGLLLAGNPDHEVVHFSNSGIVGLERQNNRWVLCCSIPPGTFA